LSSFVNVKVNFAFCLPPCPFPFPGSAAAPVASANAWVDARGSFAADLDVTRLSRANTPAWDDFVVLASGSTASISVPVTLPTAKTY
jgi:hypothetical protein